jgi:hypothetical protein
VAALQFVDHRVLAAPIEWSRPPSKNMQTNHKVLSLALLALSATLSQAAQLGVVSYDMPNGDGQAHNGTYNYWDAGYTGSGATITDGLSGSVLSGGTGKLVDGLISTQPWYDVSNSAGTGQYVGWVAPNVAAITFHFASTVLLDEIKLYVDNSHVGGVYAPDAVFVDGVSYANPSWSQASPPQLIDLTGLNLHGTSVTVTLHNFYDVVNWVFLSEAQFFGSASPVPEASSLAMMLGGVSLLSLLARRRRS